MNGQQGFKQAAHGVAGGACLCAALVMLAIPQLARGQQPSGYDSLVRGGQQQIALMNRFAELESESRAHLKAGRFAEARRVAEQALALNISNRRANQLLAEIDAAAKAAAASAPATTPSSRGRGAGTAASSSAAGRAVTPSSPRAMPGAAPGGGGRRSSGQGALAAGVARDLLRAYFAGDYEAVLSSATALEATDPPPRVFFYAACSEVALGLLDPASASDRYARARALYARAIAGGETFSEDRRFVSPRVLEVLEQRP